MILHGSPVPVSPAGPWPRRISKNLTGSQSALADLIWIGTAGPDASSAKPSLDAS
jgi:hypothetical protein